MQWNTVEITSARLSMRPFSAPDANEAFACITPTLTRYMSFDPLPSKRDFESVWREWLTDIDAGVDFTFTIRRRGTQAFLGLAGLHRAREPEPELGIWVRESEHGHAYGREAVQAVAAWGTRTFRPAAFVYPVAEANAPSRRIAESLGGTVTAHRAGPRYDLLVYRIPVDAPGASRGGEMDEAVP
ncbi:GNAT family N-acetyltransferase [Xylophilus sp. ASV27]|uniref:GNAT family N-acetyltransferase n=1 Tax=Xylophilus sp. ASV27 TaxID=2795129 RepID=UPI0018ED5C78|nr:GNAT family N-acetyltransferase [Xylophilus sp. ASV27]